MKKLLAVLVIILIGSGCDDGDLKVDTINFDEVTAVKCSDNEIIYKLNDNEVLLIEFPGNPFGESPGVKEVEVNTTNQFRYRLYTSTASSENICSNIQPSSPVVTEEWIATAGTAEITTTQVLSNPDPLTGATSIIRYNHNIIFKNLIFAKPTGNQVYETFSFGDYTTNPTSLPFDFDPENVMICPANNIIYNAQETEREALYIQDFDLALFSTDTPNLNIPKTQLLGETSNRLIYRLLKSQFGAGTIDDYFCAGASTPQLEQEWVNYGGSIEVITTPEGTGFKHTIRLKNVTFGRGNSSFYYGDDILYGYLITE